MDINAQAQLRKLVLFSSLGAAMAVTAIIDILSHGLTRTIFLEALTALTPTYLMIRIYLKLRDRRGEKE